VVADDAAEVLAVVGRVGTVQEVVVIGAAAASTGSSDLVVRDVVDDVIVVRDVVVERDDADVAQADVDADARVRAEPEEVGDLLRVGDVVGGFELFQSYSPGGANEEVGDLLRVGDVVGGLELAPCLQVVEHRSSTVRLHPQSFNNTHAHTCANPTGSQLIT